MKRIGLVVNPYAGLGGRAGFKGSDDVSIQERALEMGVEPEAPHRGAPLPQRIGKGCRRY